MPAGRPKKQPNPLAKQIELAYGAGYTRKSIAYMTGLSEKTIERNYGPSLEAGESARQNWAMDLFKRLAEEGNSTCLKFIMWRYFGYKEHDKKDDEKKQPINLTVNVDGVSQAIKSIEAEGAGVNSEQEKIHSETSDAGRGQDSTAAVTQ